jgi:3-oxoacyl-[acyl-carrier-protein] synthase-3
MTWLGLGRSGTDGVGGGVFCTQTPDHPLPPNSCVLHGRLSLSRRVMAFDIPHACSAFVYALRIVDALMRAGVGTEALIVTADAYSTLINPRDRATRVLFGDAGAATWLTRSSDGARGTGAFDCGTDGGGVASFLVPAGGARVPVTDEIRSRETTDASGNVRSPVQIVMDGQEILTFAGVRVPESINAVLDRAGLALHDVQWFVFHQASAMVLDLLTTHLGLDPARVVRSLANTGNTVSASIPITLRSALDDDRIRPGDIVLLSGFGAGLSWGSAVIRW